MEDVNTADPKEMSLEDSCQELRKLYDKRKMLQLQMDEMVREIKFDIDTLNNLISEQEAAVRDVAQRSDLEFFSRESVTIEKSIGRRTILAKPHEIKDPKIHELVTKAKIHMITVGELDRLKKERGDVDWDLVEKVINLQKPAVWIVKDMKNGEG